MGKRICICVLLSAIAIGQVGSGEPQPIPGAARDPRRDVTVRRLNSIRFAEQFSGSDIGARINTAIADLPANGGEVWVSAGDLAFRTPVVISDRPVRLRFGLAAISNVTAKGSARLTWAGGARAPITIRGAGATGTTIEGLYLDNAGKGTVGIDVDDRVQSVRLENVVISDPKVPFSVAGIRLGHTGLVTDALLDRVVLRSAAPVGLLAEWVEAHLTVMNSRLFHNRRHNVVLGTLTTDVISAHFISTTFEQRADTGNVSVVRAKNARFSDCYAEIGGTGRFLTIERNALRAVGIVMDGCWFTGNVGTPATALVRVDLPAADVTVMNSVLSGFANPHFIVENVRSGSVLVFGNRTEDYGLVPSTSAAGVVAFANRQAPGNFLEAINDPAAGAANQPLTGKGTLRFDLSAKGITCRDAELAVPGAVKGSPVVLGIPAAAALPGVQVTGWVSSTGMVTVRACDLTAEDPKIPSAPFVAEVTGSTMN